MRNIYNFVTKFFIKFEKINRVPLKINNNIIRDRHILKNDLKKCGTGDPLNFLNFFAKIVFLVLLYTTVTKFL